VQPLVTGAKLDFGGGLLGPGLQSGSSRAPQAAVVAALASHFK